MALLRGTYNNIQMLEYSDVSDVEADTNKFEARFLLKLREDELDVALNILAYCEDLFGKKRIDRLFAKLEEAENLLFP